MISLSKQKGLSRINTSFLLFSRLSGQENGRVKFVRFCSVFLLIFALKPSAQSWSATGTLSASPNPIQVCDNSGVGTTTLSWNSSGTSAVEVHIGSPSGPLFVLSSSGSNSAATGKWVSNNTTFYLQNVSNGLPLTSANTLATATVTLTATGCPVTGTISALSDPIRVCDGSGVGQTTLSWNSSFTSTVEIHINSPSGPLFAQSGPGPRAATTGRWVKDGTVFFLQNVTGGLPLTSANTIATSTVNLTSVGCGSLTATPNPIKVCDGTGKGVTTLSWNSSGTLTVEIHVGSPSGSIFTRSGPGFHSAATGKWVKEGTVFYLQDISNGLPLTTENTLAVTTVRLTTNACGSLSASPSASRVCDGTGSVSTILSWSSIGTVAVEVHAGAPTGPLFAQSGSGLGKAATGKWVKDGTVFYLQDVTGGLPLTSANTIATSTVSVTSAGCPSDRPELGVNKIDLLLQYLGNASGGNGSPSYQWTDQAMARKSIVDARNNGITYLRVAVTGFRPYTYNAPGDLDLWLKDPNSYWALCDQMMKDLNDNGVRIIPNFMWQITQFPALTGETVLQMMTNPNSLSYQLLTRYVTEFIGRYSTHPAIYFYELGNELNLKQDLNLVNRCLSDPLNTAEYCQPISNFTTDQLIAFTSRFAAFIKGLDPQHLVTSGFSNPRRAAEHLRRKPEFSSSKGDWTPDSLAEYKKNILDVHNGIDIISIHFWNNKENERLGVTGHTNADLLDITKQAADEAGKPLFIGEYGDINPSYYEDPSGLFTQNTLKKIVDLKIPFSTVWAWEFYQTSPYQTYNSQTTLDNLEPGFTDLLLGKIKEANKSLGNLVPLPQIPDTTSPQVVLTWPLDQATLKCSAMVYAVSSDNNGSVAAVNFSVDGTPYPTLAAPPYLSTLDVSPWPTGVHQLSVKAVDAAGNIGTDTRSVNIAACQ